MADSPLKNKNLRLAMCLRLESIIPMGTRTPLHKTSAKQRVATPDYSLLSLVRMLWKHKLLTLAIWAGISAVAVAIVWRLPAIYSAQAVVLVDAQKIPERYVSSSVNTDVQDRLATISQQILSGPRLKKIIDDYGLYREERGKMVQEEIVELMRSDIDIKVDRSWTGGKAGAFRVGYEGRDPVVVAQVANRIANLYVEENLRTRELQAEGTSEFIETQVQQAKRKLDEMETAVSNYKMQHNGELPQQENSLGQAVVHQQMELQNLRDAKRRMEDSKSVLEGALSLAESTMQSVQKGNPVITPVPTVAAVATPPLPAKAAAPPRLSEELEAQVKALLARYNDQHPDVKRLRIAIESAKQAEREEDSRRAIGAPTVADVKPPSGDVAPAAPPAPTAPRLELIQAQEHVNSLKTQVANIEKELASNASDQARITNAIEVLQGRINRLPAREQELALITRDYETTKQDYRSLLDKRLSAEMSTDMERRQKSERFTVIDPAHVAEKPVKPNRPVFAGLGSLTGLLIALAIPLVNELRKGQILGEWELPEGIPILVRLPYVEIPATETQSKRHKFVSGRSLGVATSGLLLLAGISYFLTRWF